MDPVLTEIVRSVKSRYQANPPGDIEVDSGTLLQIEILRSGYEFDEEDVLKAAEMIGVPEGDLIAWLEEMASWI